MIENSHRSGFVAIIGAPNVGKSTLLNRILGQKVAITSPKPQTTRHRLLGVWTAPDGQVIFLDTPGIHDARDLLNRQLVKQALAALAEADLILFLIEPERRDADHRLVIEALRQHKQPALLAINKIDRVNKSVLLPIIDRYSRELPLAALVPVSALTGENVDRLLMEILANLPEGPQFYPPDLVTDQPERFIAAEMIREQVFNLTTREIPYSTAVTVEEFDESREDLVRITGYIHVERDSQKGIVIGRQGAMLKKIGSAAREDIERLLGVKVFLKLFVRVEKNWSKDPRALRRFGYDPAVK